jgi:hypothetical protein
MDLYSAFLRDEAQHGEEPGPAREELYSRSAYAAGEMDAAPVYDLAEVRERIQWEREHINECAKDTPVLVPTEAGTMRVNVCPTCFFRVWRNHGASVAAAFKEAA